MATANPVNALILASEDPVGRVVSDLCRVDVLNGRYRVQTPVVTASGSLVDVSVWPEGQAGTFMVCDDGVAHHEVLSAGGNSSTFTRVARQAADNHGASFDGMSLLFLRLSLDQLRGGIIALSNLVREVIDTSIEKSFEAHLDQQREAFLRIAAAAFANQKVTENARVFGQTTTEYRFDFAVDLPDRQLVLDYFGPSGNALNAAYVKFSDVTRREDAPRTVGVTPDIKRIGSKLALISSVASVVQSDAPESVYRRMLAA